MSLVSSLHARADATAFGLPAFLDALDTVRVAFPEPVSLEEARREYTLQASSGDIPVVAVDPGGAPTRARRLPRTPGRVVLAGTIQTPLGGYEWDPDGEVTQMTETRPGVHELVVSLPKGRYEFKVARNGSWGENYGEGFEPGGRNIVLDVPADPTIVRFVVDFSERAILDSVRHPDRVEAPAAAPTVPVVDRTQDKYDVYTLRLDRHVTARDVSQPMRLLSEDGRSRTVFARDVLSAPPFVFDGDGLGAQWSPGSTMFKVWSPVSSSTDLLMYDTAEGGESRIVPMTRGTAGVWYVRVRGNLHGTYYRYRFRSYGQIREAADIYGIAANADANRTMVLATDRAQPQGWPGPPLPRRTSDTDAVLYEIQVRDFTVLPESGVQPDYRGKYLGLAQSNTKSPLTGQVTGLDYLVQLGVTDVHLLPIQSTVTLRAGGEYGWGYATTLFNVPEEQFSTTPQDPVQTIREVRQMVMAMHAAGLRVVMDVVYNHTWPPEGDGSAFEQTVPYHFFRTNDRGELLNESGVGNAMADERPMVRRFIRDSLLYWLQEYQIDGFRFDLLGMHHPDSIRNWEHALRRVRPDVLLYGEPWTGGGPTHFGKGAQRGMGVAVFNDTFRGAIRGDTDGSGPGFATGAKTGDDLLRAILTGSLRTGPGGRGFTDKPSESINYVSAHDNLTLWDKIQHSLPDADAKERARAVKLATAAVLLSQGIPFLEGGVEIGRTKGGDHNSYDANDEVNAYHWSRAAEFQDVHAYVQGVIALRKRLPALRMNDSERIRNEIEFLDTARLPDNTVAFRLPGQPRWSEALIVLHGSRESAEMNLPEGQWSILADARSAGASPQGNADGTFNLEPLTAYVLVR